MVGKYDLLQMQREQFRHDERNHKDILCLPKPDRLKHYGLHYAKICWPSCARRSGGEEQRADVD
jgi:hypothetical protein